MPILKLGVGERTKPTLSRTALEINHRPPSFPEHDGSEYPSSSVGVKRTGNPSFCSVGIKNA